MLAAFTVPCQVVKTISSPSTAYQVGTACGRPSSRTDAKLAVMLPDRRKRQASSSDILWGIERLLGFGGWSSAFGERSPASIHRQPTGAKDSGGVTMRMRAFPVLIAHV